MSNFVTLVSLWLKAPPHLQQLVLDEARRMHRSQTIEKLKASTSDCPAIRTIEESAASIAVAMASIHGGKWRIEIDHSVGYLLVRQV